jgi:hypothetical protein
MASLFGFVYRGSFLGQKTRIPTSYTFPLDNLSLGS